MPCSELPRIVTISTHIYNCALWICPRRYRREYGALMAQVFRDLCSNAYGQNGARGLGRLWIRALLDVGATAAGEHMASLKAGRALQIAGPALLALLVGGAALLVNRPPETNAFRATPQAEARGQQNPSIAPHDVSPAHTLTTGERVQIIGNRWIEVEQKGAARFEVHTDGRFVSLNFGG